ncbi:MAG: type I methionyl aminopeptidase [Calditrichota bacterium]
MIRLKSPSEIQKMRRAGRHLAKTFQNIFELLKPGIDTAELDKVLEHNIRSEGGRPAFKGYRGAGTKPFPASSCISINEAVVHGVPSSRRLEAGQIVGIDTGLELDGWFSDMAATFLIGEVDETYQRLWRVTREALYQGIDQARSGRYISDIGAAVQDWVERNGFSIIRDLVGHGIGSDLHEEPAIPNYRTPGAKIKIHPGMTLAIEPMVSAGQWQIKTLSDGWTAVTQDGSPTAHFEHTVLVTDGEPEILTLLPDGSDPWLIAARRQE